MRLVRFIYQPLSVCSFHDDAPKDYRQVSLTAVKQRFEDKCYDEISQEEVCSPLPLRLLVEFPE